MKDIKLKTIDEEFDDAMLQMQIYIKFLNAYKDELKGAKAIVDFVVENENQTQALTDMIKNFAFSTFAQTKRYIEKINTEKRMYVKKFQKYIQDNEDKKALFCETMFNLQNLLTKYGKVTDKQIKRCFEYIKNSIEDTKNL